MAAFIVMACQVWLAIGLVVALWFALFAIGRIDPAARGAYAFRPLLLPGIALLWPLVIWRWRQMTRHESGEA